MTKEVMEGRFEWKEQLEQIVERIDSWNGIEGKREMPTVHLI